MLGTAQYLWWAHDRKSVNAKKKSLSRMENVSKILLSRMDHKLKKSLSRI